jgi:transcriptional antiterminator Rof (Rho-off)
MPSEYQAIPCIQHEQLEYAVLKRTPLDLHYTEPGGSETCARVLPLDVYTHDRAEWLKARREDGVEILLRLDWISSFSYLSGS